MGFFSSSNSAGDLDLTAEDLATCEGYVTREAFRRLQEAKGAARRDAGGAFYKLARLVATRIADAVVPAGGAAPAQESAPVTPSRSPAPSPAPTSPAGASADAHIDRAA